VVTCKNNSLVKIELPKITSYSTYTDFTGESTVNFEAGKTLQMHCLYNRTISKIERDKFGIVEEVVSRVFISPLELKKQLGEYRFPKQVMSSKAGIRVTLFDEIYLVQQIIELEPMEVVETKQSLSIAIELRLSSLPRKK